MLLIRNANIVGRGMSDILIGDDGKYLEIKPEIRAEGIENCEVIDARGMLAAPTFVNTHMHFDKAYTALKGRESSVETLEDSIHIMHDFKRHYTVEEVKARAERAIRECVMFGTTKLRTNVDIDNMCGLVGLEGVKAEVHSLVNLMKVRRLREAAGLPTPPLSLHLVFVGNPGTGKTTVARLIGQLYRAIGILSQGQLVEVDRSGLVAGYVGQTALKTQEVLQSALGGVLFLDEAYALAPASPTDYGREAIEVLLKGMEDHRKDLVVIAAGYPDPMEDFLHSNPGLASRFPKTLVFADYTPPQLLAIFQGLCRKNGYTLPPETEAAAAARFQALYDSRDAHFGNARTARNTFEDAVARQADRVAALEAPSREDLMALLPQDLAGA